MKQSKREAAGQPVPEQGSLGLLAQGWRGTLAWRQAKKQASQKERS